MLLPGMDAPSLAAAMDGFSAFLYSFTPDAYGVRTVLSSRLSRDISQRALSLFCGAYRQLSEQVLDPGNRYEFPSTMLSRTPSEVETILGVEVAVRAT